MLKIRNETVRSNLHVSVLLSLWPHVGVPLERNRDIKRTSPPADDLLAWVF